MAKIIRLTTFSGNEAAEQLAALKVYRCDTVIYCKTEAEAKCYCNLIDCFSYSGKGVDHLHGIIAICVDPSSTKIEGMHLISQRLPTHIKSSYPFQLKVKKIGETMQAKILEECGLKTEKELKEVWERCAQRLTFPIEATADEKEDYVNIFDMASAIIRDEANAKKNEINKDIKMTESVITEWFNKNFNSFSHPTDAYGWKSWRAIHRVIDYKSYAFNLEMQCSSLSGVESFRVKFDGLDVSFLLPWLDDKNVTVVLTRLDKLLTKFNTIMEAITEAHSIATVNITAP